LSIKFAKDEKVTCDTKVATLVWRRNRGWAADMAGLLESADFVGWIEEILELDYRNHCCIVFICSWIPGNMSASNAKVVYDDYGFKLGNFV
jgi:hypothetical protein